MFKFFHCRFLLDYLTGQYVLGMELVGRDAINVLQSILGHKDPMKAEAGTIRALYGTDPVRNCIHAATSLEDALFVSEVFW